jgi:hypothetical protein
MKKIPTKMLRKLIFNFYPQKTAKNTPFWPFKMTVTKKRSSVRAEILRVILKKIVLGLDGKNSTKDAQEDEFQFKKKKNRQKYPLSGPLE